MSPVLPDTPANLDFTVWLAATSAGRLAARVIPATPRDLVVKDIAANQVSTSVTTVRVATENPVLPDLVVELVYSVRPVATSVADRATWVTPVMRRDPVVMN